MGLWRILHPPTGKEGQQPTYVVATGSVPKRPRARSPLRRRRRRFYRPSLSQTVFEIADLPSFLPFLQEREGRNEDRRTLSQTEEGREREGGEGGWMGYLIIFNAAAAAQFVGLPPPPPPLLLLKNFSN